MFLSSLLLYIAFLSVQAQTMLPDPLRFMEQYDPPYYVGLSTPLLGGDGRPDESLFRNDGFPLNKRGYAGCTRVPGKRDK